MNTVEEWKRAMQGIAEGVIPGLTMHVEQDGDDTNRYYTAPPGQIVLSMIVHGSNTDQPGHELRRTFYVHPDILTRTAHLQIQELDE